MYDNEQRMQERMTLAVLRSEFKSETLQERSILLVSPIVNSIATEAEVYGTLEKYFETADAVEQAAVLDAPPLSQRLLMPHFVGFGVIVPASTADIFLPNVPVARVALLRFSESTAAARARELLKSKITAISWKYGCGQPVEIATLRSETSVLATATFKSAASGDHDGLIAQPSTVDAPRKRAEPSGDDVEGVPVTAPARASEHVHDSTHISPPVQQKRVRR